jgi:cytochrome subunit of sulfide dehydrogenase
VKVTPPLIRGPVATLSIAVLCGYVLAAHAAPDKVVVCAQCHGEDGTGAGYPYVPIIAGIPAGHLEEALFAYKDGARQCVGVPVMCDVVLALGDDDIIELAAYYGRMQRVASGESFDEQLAIIGEQLHEQHCARCHVPPDDENAADALGIPLLGQRTAYLRLALGAYMTGNRKTLVPAMAEKLELLRPGDIEALVNYYASYRQ